MEASPESTPEPTPEATPEPKPKSSPGTLTPKDVDDPWPFAVDRVVLRCEGASGSGSVIVTAGGKEYGVNGTAQAEYPAFDPIWKKNPDVPGTKVNISEVLDLGLALCDG